jgi:hypothetical protein
MEPPPARGYYAYQDHHGGSMSKELIEQYEQRRLALDRIVQRHNTADTNDSEECQAALEDMARTDDILRKLRNGEDVTFVNLRGLTVTKDC